MFDYGSFLAQQMRYEDDVRQAASDRLARQTQHRSSNLSFSAFNSLAVIGAILFAIVILVASGVAP
ncbi:MAG TPA: hypothetical protein VF932_01985 [Anaerolineae bacterium]